jgi:uncharacterized membrane protein YkvA (DUF1232 family)
MCRPRERLSPTRSDTHLELGSSIMNDSLGERREPSAMTVLERMKGWARTIRQDVIALWLAARDPRTPWYAKVVAACVAAYALSPIDLIPDFIPVLGYLDDLLIVPLGILLTVYLIPDELMAEFRSKAARREGEPRSPAGAAIVVLVWLLAAGLILWWLWPREAY